MNGMKTKTLKEAQEDLKYWERMLLKAKTGVWKATCETHVLHAQNRVDKLTKLEEMK